MEEKNFTDAELDSMKESIKKCMANELESEEQIQVMRKVATKMGIMDTPIRDLKTPEEWAESVNDLKPKAHAKLMEHEPYQKLVRMIEEPSQWKIGERDSGVDFLLELLDMIQTQIGQMNEEPKKFANNTIQWLLIMHRFSKGQTQKDTYREHLNSVENHIKVLVKSMQDSMKEQKKIVSEYQRKYMGFK